MKKIFIFFPCFVFASWIAFARFGQRKKKVEEHKYITNVRNPSKDSVQCIFARGVATVKSKNHSQYQGRQNGDFQVVCSTWASFGFA